ncbi:MAG: hypothetical protein EZS28_039071, partial [Streblomastix strix]
SAKFAVFPPQFRELPKPHLELFDLEEEFASERVALIKTDQQIPFDRNVEMIIIMSDLFLLDNLNVEHHPMKYIHLEASKFPGDVGACKVLKKTPNVGNMILNVRLGVSLVLGLTPGCDLDTPRSYLLRIYLVIHVHKLGIKFPSNVEAYSENGELYEELNYFFGRATSSIFMIRGGVKFVEDQNESSYTIIDVDTGHCLADVQLAEYEDPFTFTLSTLFEERSCKHIFNCCRWRKKHSMDVYHVEQPTHKYLSSG